MFFGNKNAIAVQAVASHAVFYKVSQTGNDSAVVEVYWNVDPASLHYHRDANKLLSASINIEITMSAADGSRLTGDKYTFNTRPLPDSAAAVNTIVELRRYIIALQPARLQLQIGETGFPASDFIYADSVNAGPATKPWYSSLQLLDTFYQSPAKTSFLKGDKQQIPRFINFLDEGQHNLQSYFEVYRTNGLPAEDYPLVQFFYITTKNSTTPVYPYILRDTITQGAAYQQFLRRFTINTLPSGNYYLRSELRNKAGVAIAAAATFFQTINKHPEVKESHTFDTSATTERVNVFDLSKTFVAKFTPAQLRAILRMVTPVAGPDDILAINAFLRKPDEIYMRYFIYNFFSHRSTTAEKAWKSYSDSIRYVNKEFSSGGTFGYETDRGRVFLKYGPPINQIKVPSELGSHPYEIWLYNSAGRRNEQGVFLFYQPGFAGGDLVLLHSNFPGEPRNEAWRSVLYGAGGANPNTTTRAEQYIGNR